MNVLIINGSARDKGFCDYIAKNLIDALNNLSNKINVDYFNIPKCNINFCKGCVSCCADEKKYCFIDDDIKKAYTLLEKADSIVYISPIYESFISGVLKNFFDRTNHYTSFFKLAGKNLNLILTGVQPLYGKNKEFSNIHVVKNINQYFRQYAVITHTKYNYLGFFQHLNHHSIEDDSTREKNKLQINAIAQIIIKQKINYKMIENSKESYSV